MCVGLWVLKVSLGEERCGMGAYAVTFTQQVEVTIYLDAEDAEMAEEKAGELIDKLYTFVDTDKISKDVDDVEVNVDGCWDQANLEEV